MKEERNLKILKEKKARELEEQRLKEEERERRNKKKIGEPKVSYDYSGETMKIKVENRANLVGKGTKTNTKAKLKVNKEAINDPNPTTLEGEFKGKKAAASPSSNFGKKPTIHFNENRSISEGVEALPGTKFVH